MNELVVFAKYWQSGRVKTRLVPQIGAPRASALHRCFLTTTLERMSGCGDRRCLVYSPPESEAQFRRLVAGRPWQLRQQEGEDLGARLNNDMQSSFRAGNRRVVIVGADSPTLPLVWIDRAFELLESHDVTLGPTDDGGYYLIGLRRPLAMLFERIDWGTRRVWAQTMDRLQAVSGSFSFAVLPLWYDVDRPADLRRLADELASAPASDAVLARLSQCVRRALGG
jgi:rSAM/selenodomain-associated transferase 1